MGCPGLSVRGPGRAGPVLPLLPPGHAGSEGSDLLLALPPVLPLRHTLLQLPVLLQAAGPRDPGIQGILVLLGLAPLRRRAAPGVPGLRHGELGTRERRWPRGHPEPSAPSPCTSPQPWVPSTLLSPLPSPPKGPHSPGMSSALHDPHPTHGCPPPQQAAPVPAQRGPFKAGVWHGTSGTWHGRGGAR